MSESAQTWAYLLIRFILFCHAMTCWWLVMAVAGQSQGEAHWAQWALEEDGIMGYEDWDGSVEDGAALRLYPRAMNFIYVTITTIGYGDITAATDAERLVNLFIIVVGFFVVQSTVIGFIGLIFAGVDGNSNRAKGIETLNSIYKTYCLPLELYTQAKRNINQ